MIRWNYLFFPNSWVACVRLLYPERIHIYIAKITLGRGQVQQRFNRVSNQVGWPTAPFSLDWGVFWTVPDKREQLTTLPWHCRASMSGQVLPTRVDGKGKSLHSTGFSVPSQREGGGDFQLWQPLSKRGLLLLCLPQQYPSSVFPEGEGGSRPSFKWGRDFFHSTNSMLRTGFTNY